MSTHRIKTELRNRRWTRGGSRRTSGYRTWVGELILFAVSGAGATLMLGGAGGNGGVFALTTTERWLLASASGLSIVAIGAFWLSRDALPKLTRAGRRVAVDVEAFRKQLASKDLPVAGDPFRLLACHGRDYAWAVGFGLLPDPLRHR